MGGGARKLGVGRQVAPRPWVARIDALWLAQSAEAHAPTRPPAPDPATTPGACGAGKPRYKALCAAAARRLTACARR